MLLHLTRSACSDLSCPLPTRATATMTPGIQAPFCFLLLLVPVLTGEGRQVGRGYPHSLPVGFVSWQVAPHQAGIADRWPSLCQNKGDRLRDDPPGEWVPGQVNFLKRSPGWGWEWERPER